MKGHKVTGRLLCGKNLVDWAEQFFDRDLKRKKPKPKRQNNH